MSDAPDRVRGRTARGRPCELVNRTGDALPRPELERLLAELVAARAFEFQARGGGEGVALGRPQFAHVQVAGRLYRLIVERRAARLEPF
jgi:hypothetical protein